MSFMYSRDSAHSFWTGAGALWIFSAAVSAMDPPRTGDSSFYGWLYRFTHLLAANLDRVIRPLAPGIMENQTHTQNEENDINGPHTAGN